MSRIHLRNHPDDEKGAGEADVDPLLVSGSMMSHDMPQKRTESDGARPGTSINIGESEMKIAHKVAPASCGRLAGDPVSATVL